MYIPTHTCTIYIYILFFTWHNSPHWAMAPSFTRFLDHIRRTTVGRTPLDEWSACRRYLYLTTHNTHNRQTSMPPVGFEPTISADERPQTYALDRAVTGTGYIYTGTVHKEKGKLEDQRRDGGNSCNSGDGTGQRAQPLTFMMMMMIYIYIRIYIYIHTRIYN